MAGASTADGTEAEAGGTGPQRTWAQLGARMLAAVASGALLSVLVPPFGHHYLHWVAYLPAFWMLREGERRTNLWLSFLFGVAAQSLIFVWIVETITIFTNIPTVLAWGILLLFAAGYGLPYLAMWAMVLPLRRRLGTWWMLAFPAWCVLVDFAASRLTLFPYQQGISQYSFLPTYQLASVTGIWGLTYLVVGFNTVWAEGLFRHREGRPFPVAWLLGWVAVLGGVTAWGAHRVGTVEAQLAEAETFRFEQIQLDKGMQWRMSHPASDTWEMWLEASMAVPEGAVDLHIWPEGASPYPLNGQLASLMLWDLSADRDADLIIGAGTREREPNPVMGESKVRSFNSVYAFDRRERGEVPTVDPEQDFLALVADGCDLVAAHVFTPFEARVLAAVGARRAGLDIPPRLASLLAEVPAGVAGPDEADCTGKLAAHEQALRIGKAISEGFDDRMARSATTYSQVRHATARFDAPLQETRFRTRLSSGWVWTAVDGSCDNDDCDGFSFRCPTNEVCSYYPAPPHYDKMVPLPFGEYLPGATTFPWLSDLIEGGPGNFRAGTEPLVFDVGGVRMPTPICYEGILGYICAQFEQPDVLVNLTNDAWFGTGAASDLHGMLVTTRAVEMGLPVIRSTYSGTSFVVEPHGQVYAKTPLFTFVNRAVDVRNLQMPTFYAAWGDWFVWLCALGLAGAWWGMARREDPA